ncbi:amidohydrolase family protein [Weissella cibaria]|uniref:metal-dependent hydrolase family protein n=1 Tax=Weissella cibaria TaxID=137591 RepID=UPI001194B546|nr:amidohydrolase family protein [Weissella cibaria]MCA1356343.1 amidohydrolase family protein [Weissella cibaria]MDQ2125307.1 amidohydrolase family protein [Weissella cibaria]MDQ2158662.1 amidohydrolase family protein [Weissella cibaria]TVV25451.1 amidohydrolase family protein [Weissella cibaria]
MAIITYTDGAIFQAGQFVAQSFTVDTTQGVFVTPDTPADEIVSLAGQYVVPGLINAHTHVTDLVAADQSPALTNMTEAEVTVFAQKNLRDLLRDGVTTIRNVGSFANIDLSLARLEQLGVITAPLIVGSGPALTMTGGHGSAGIAREVDGPDEVRRATRQLLKAGATAIKVMATGGVTSRDGEQPDQVQLSVAEMAAAVAEAHHRNVPVAAHAQGNQGIKNAILAGVDSIEHAIFLDDEAIEQLLAADIAVVPTFGAPHAIDQHPEAVPAWMYQKNKAVIASHRQSIARAISAGVRLVMGTDAGTPFNDFRHGSTQELAYMVAAGQTPAEALLSATQNAAELLRVADKVGSITVGKQADFIIVTANPLTDITVLTGQKTVYRKGQAVN